MTYGIINSKNNHTFESFQRYISHYVYALKRDQESLCILLFFALPRAKWPRPILVGWVFCCYLHCICIVWLVINHFSTIFNGQSELSIDLCEVVHNVDLIYHIASIRLCDRITKNTTATHTHTKNKRSRNILCERKMVFTNSKRFIANEYDAKNTICAMWRQPNMKTHNELFIASLLLDWPVAFISKQLARFEVEFN